MPAIIFDYLPSAYIEENKLVAIYNPVINLVIGANKKVYPSTDCIVDSGSEFNLMPSYIADYLGIDIRKGKKETHVGIGNVGIVAYSHPVTIYLEGYKFDTNVHFSYDHKIPIMGRYGFFRYFKKIIFNEKKLRLELAY